MTRIGFCCKPLDSQGQPIPELNMRGTTMRWLRENPSQAEDKIYELIDHNLRAAEQLVWWVAQLKPNQRMVRLGSDILPGYTEPNWAQWWQRSDIQNWIAPKFAQIGQAARELDVRLSFHPGQFVVLASDRAEIVERSIEEFEYHAHMAAMMGYGVRFQDFKCNVHISGRAGADGIRKVWPRLSDVARNIITIENEEIKHGLDTVLSLGDLVPIVLDVHHHWVREGEYIDPSDPRVAQVIDSWRGVRPAMHYSVSRSAVIPQASATVRPDRAALMAQGVTRTQLRAHSDDYWNHAVNDWVLGFADQFDIQCECKLKNLASSKLAALL